MAKVILIDPRGFLNVAQGSQAFPNVGIAYLVSSLKNAGHECLVIDSNNNVVSDVYIFDRIQDYCPDLVGFSIKSSTVAESRRLAEEIKKHYPGIPIIAGGLHATIAWRDLIVQPWFDIVFIGEGEKILPEICRRLLAGADIRDLPGVLTKDNYEADLSGKQYLTPAVELNDLPVPAYELFSESVRQSLKKEYPLVTSRGCVYRCTYCSVPRINGKVCRMRSAASVVAELREAHTKYGTTAFQVIDDLFNFDTVRCKQICMALIESGLSMQWSCPNGLRADRIEPELAGLMYQAGCRSVNIGIESVDRNVLVAANKGETIDDIERGIRTFQSAGISVGGFFIIGLPGDSLETQKRNLAFCQKVGIGALFGMLVPYPGTELWDWAKKNARFTRSFEEGLHYSVTSVKPESIIETDNFSAAARLRAYEMIYTRLGQFSRLIPSHVRGLRSLLRVVALLWKYDKGSLVPYVFKAMMNKAKRMAKRQHECTSPRQGSSRCKKPSLLKLYCYYTSAYEVLLQEWFLPSLKDDYKVILKRDDYGGSSVAYKDKGWHHITREKTNFIISAIKEAWGDVFIFTDPDIQFFKETKPMVLCLSRNNDLVFQRDNPQGVLCSGFFACRANKKTLRLWEDIRDYIGTNESDDQDSLNHLLLSGPFLRYCAASQRVALSRLGINTYRIPWGYFPAEFYGAGALTGTVWQPGKELPVPEGISMHHANYARGIDDKIAQLRFVKNVIQSRKSF